MERVSPNSIALREVWLLRYQRRIETCVGHLAAIKDRLGLPPGVPSIDFLLPLMTAPADASVADSVIQAVLLQGSMARASQEFGVSESCIQLAYQLKSRLAVRGECDFYLAFEAGINQLVKGDHSTSLELFMQAALSTSDPLLKLLARVNSIFCLDHVGLPWQEALSEVRDMMECLQIECILTPIRNQLAVFELRQSFRSGDFDSIFVPSHPDSESFLQETEYFKAWIELLPYHRHARADGGFHSKMLKDSGYFHQKTYRARTLRGSLHPDDLNQSSPMEAVDRVYLWVWQWLRDPAHFSVQRALTVLEKMPGLQGTSPFTAEDCQLLRNALLWLMLFDPSSEREIQNRLGDLRYPCSADSSLLSFEKLVIFWLKALRDGEKLLADDILADLRHHPLWSQPTFLFRELCEAVLMDSSVPRDPSGPPGLESLVSELKVLVGSRNGVPGNGTARINLSSHEVQYDHGRERQISEPLALALDLLKRKSPVSCEEFAQACFGIVRFDSLIHNSRIFNLLSRMRLVVGPALLLGVKSGQVWAEGSWDSIEFSKDTRFTRDLSALPQWARLKSRRWDLRSSASFSPLASSSVPARGTLSPRMIPRGRLLTREEIEVLLKRPRSTVNRALADWVKSGVMKREGAGRNSRYRIQVNREKSV